MNFCANKQVPSILVLMLTMLVFYFCRLSTSGSCSNLLRRQIFFSCVCLFALPWLFYFPEEAIFTAASSKTFELSLSGMFASHLGMVGAISIYIYFQLIRVC